MKKIKLFSVITMLLVLLTSCGGKSALVGHWERENSHGTLNEFDFFSNGMYTSDHSNYEGQYSVDGDRLMLQGVMVDSLTYTFKINGKKMTLYYTDGDRGEMATYEKTEK